MELPQLFDEREVFLESLLNFIKSIKRKDFNIEEDNENKEDTRVISIDADWGCGKTTFMKHLEVKLKAEDFIVFKFDAWKNDFEKEPLSVFIQDLIPQILDANHEDYEDIVKYKEKMYSLISATNSIIKFTTKFIPIIPETDIIDIMEEMKLNREKVSRQDSGSLLLSTGKTGIKKLQDDFIKALNTITPASDKKIIILIDELDRCRPTFAVELLERVKHLFDTGKYLFVFTICRKQLTESVKKIYGNAFDDSGYFRRFFDFEFYLPEPQKSEVLEHLSFARNDLLKNSENINILRDGCLFNIALIPHISLRNLQKAKDFIKLVMDLIINLNFNDNEKIYLMFGIIVRFVSKSLFENLYLNRNNRINDYNYEILDNIFGAYTERCGNSDNLHTEMKMKDWLSCFKKAELLSEEDQLEIGKYKKLVLYSKAPFGDFYFYSSVGENFFFYTDMKIKSLNSILLFGANQLYILEQ